MHSSHAPGKGLLKAAGVLYMIFDILPFCIALYILLFLVLAPLPGTSAMLLSDLDFATIAFFLQCIFGMVVGCILVVNCKKPENAVMLRVMVVVHLVLLVLALFTEFFPIFLTALLIPSLPVPIVAWIGVERNARANK